MICPGFNDLRISGFDNHFLIEHGIVIFSELKFINILIGKEACISRINDFNFLHHLANNSFNVLIIDLHTLQTVYFLNFIH